MPSPFSGSPTEVLVVGSLHLGADTPDQALASAVKRFVAWKPDRVAVEILPGELVELYERQGGWLDELTYGGFPVARSLGAQAQALTGWSRAEAARKSADAAAPEERLLAFLVLREPWNALLHWYSDSSLPADLNAPMARLAAHHSESVRLGVAVARTLGQHRLCLFDDFPVWEMTPEQQTEFEQGAATPEFQAWLAAQPFNVQMQEIQSQQTGDFWPILQALNTPAMVDAVGALETGANLRLGLAGRAKQADWDARNLLMAGRLRMVMGEHVGGRILAIVGHSHKGPWKQRYRSWGQISVSWI